MNRNTYKLIMISSSIVSFIAIIIIFLRGNILPQFLDENKIITIYSSKNYYIQSLSLVFCYLIPLSSFICFILRKDSVAASLPIFIIATSLALIIIGAMTFVFPNLINFPIDVQKETTKILMTITINIGIISALTYSIGISLLSIKLFRLENESFLPSILFLFHGIILSFGFSNIYLLMIGWLFLSISLIIFGFILNK